MASIATHLYSSSYILRSGGADGADTAFEYGADEGYKLRKIINPVTGERHWENPHYKEIYLPWANFNGRKNGDEGIIYTPASDNWSEACNLARSIHPNPDALTKGSLALHARNCYQVLGMDLNTPVDTVICWTDPAYTTGGTRTAVMLAKKWGIPIWNLAQQEWLNLCNTLIKDDKNTKQRTGTETSNIEEGNNQ